jgi:bifunctional enzyme CysN/CysC
MLPGRSYLIKCGQQWSNGTVSALKHKVSMTTLEGVPAHALELNDIGFCNVSSNRPLVFDPYEQNRTMGSFILVDRMTYRTVGAGLILYALRRATNIHWQAVDINKAARASLIHQKPCCLWFTGLSGSGKSTIANLLEKRLHAAGRLTYNLDGDNIRHGLSRDLGFTDADRVENIRRVAHVAKLMVDAGVIVLACFISPFRAERRMVREMLEKDEFVEIFVDTPIAVCEQRDPKGLYRKAREGKITNFTGISSPYEIPEQAEIHVRAGETDVNAIVEQIMDVLRNRKLMT